jgi:phosphoribosylanthranilate isomerase
VTLVVKICGIRDAHHATVAVDAGVDALGFVFATSPRKISVRDARAICENLPVRIRRVAVMLHPTRRQWQEVLHRFQPDVLQTDAGDFSSLDVPPAIERWPVYREGGDRPDCKGVYIYEGAKSGQSELVDWTQAASHARDGRMILAGGLHAGNVAAAIREVRPAGVDVSSGVESQRGQKDAQRIEEFIQAVRAAEKKS